MYNKFETLFVKGMWFTYTVYANKYFEFLIFLWVNLMMFATAIETYDERITNDKHILNMCICRSCYVN